MDDRFYFEKSNLKNNEISFSQQESRHISMVRRLKIGDKINAFCGDGYDYFLQISQISKNIVTANVISKKYNITNSNKHLTVFLAVIKNDALNTVVENLTQLNVEKLVLFHSQYSNAKVLHDKLDKLKNISIQSCKQCERAKILEICIIDKKQVIEELSNYDLTILAYENEKNNYSNLNFENVNNVAIIVGCEGGFSPVEVDEFDKAHVKSISLGKTILKAEVACTVLAGCVMNSLGQWGR